MLKNLKYILFEAYHRPSAKINHIYVIIKKIFYNQKTNLISEKMFLLKSPPKTLVYYNLLGRLFYMIINFIYILLFKKFFDKSILLENNDIEKKGLNNLSGNDYSPWPKQALHLFEDKNEKISSDFIDKIDNNYSKSLEMIIKDPLFKDTDWWLECRNEFKKIFLNDKNKVNLNALNNFRNNSETKAEILEYHNYISSQNSKFKNMVKSLSLVNLYHKLSDHIDLNILRMSSESEIGNDLCPQYRGQRLSVRILRYAYYASQIQKNTNLKTNNKNTIIDIGGGYGGLSRILKNIYLESTFVIIELPELCFLATFFLKKCFPNKKIGTLSDFSQLQSITKKDIVDYDFIILPQPMVEKFADETFDLCINTTSLGEMTNDMQSYYINHIERLSNDYFYSVNRAKERLDKYNTKGFYDFQFNKRWDAIIYDFTHTYHLEFLGKKRK
tara:strand:+ start:4838 stop:6166 length:1329 start_codon:yes stop_codon:yes gene_type:complete